MIWRRDLDSSSFRSGFHVGLTGVLTLLGSASETGSESMSATAVRIGVLTGLGGWIGPWLLGLGGWVAWCLLRVLPLRPLLLCLCR